jgi:5-formyltetrahydrofolate cyclo-ligase
MREGGAPDATDLMERSRQVRDAIDPVRRLAQSEAIHERLYELEGFRRANALALYFSTGSEVITGPLSVRLAEQEGKRIFLPFELNESLELTEWRPSDPVVDAPHGGMQPRYRRAVPLEEVDIIIVPGLAFDRSGGLLGEWTGPVDDLLRRLPRRAGRIGLAFGEQVVPEVPPREDAERVHAVVTDTEVIVCDPDFELSLVR